MAGKETDPVVNSVQTRFEEALALHQNGSLAQAREIYLRVLEMHPGHADAHHLAGVIAYQSGNLRQAADLIGRAIELNPGMVAAYSNRGLVLRDLRRPEEALASYDRALALKPDLAVAHCNRGLVLQDLGRLDDAVASYDTALGLQPDYAEARANRGDALKELGRLEDALESYDRALALKPDLATVPWNLALCRLLTGDFARGWEGYERRWDVPQLAGQIGKKRHYAQPLWLGAEPLQGKDLLLYGEGGLGDTIQFCRYAKLAAAAGARVILEVPRSLHALLKDLAGVAQVVEQGGALPKFDFHCPLPSLPLAFRTRLDNVPSFDAYVACQPAKLAEWKARLGETGKPRIGLVWSGSVKHTNDRNRSIALRELIAQLPTHAQYVSLQKETRPADAETLAAHGEILRFEEQLRDFSDTAALCELMDVIVSVDTSVAHLAGALGKPVWILLPFVPDWRWMLEREDSVWYPSARLFRQDQAGDWAGVLASLRTALLQRH